MITFILIEPKTPGNVGASARVLKNFGFSRLIIINPKCDCTGKEAMDRARHATDILRKAKIAPKSILSCFHTVIATTSKLGTDYNIPRSPLTPKQLVQVLPKKVWSEKNSPSIAILIGPEGDGLSNNHISESDFVLTIPTDPRYPALNVSHAVGIIAYELSNHRQAAKIGDHITLATHQERNQMMKMIYSLIDSLHFSTPEKKRTQRKVWKRIFAKSFLSRRESFAVMGLLRKLLSR